MIAVIMNIIRQILGVVMVHADKMSYNVQLILNSVLLIYLTYVKMECVLYHLMNV